MKQIKSLVKNKQYQVTVRDLGKHGEGIGYLEDVRIFIPGALPNETVQVKLIKISRTYAVGKLLEILSPSPDRVDPPCPIQSECGGCQLQHLSYSAQLHYKYQHLVSLYQQQGLAASVLVPPMGMTSPVGYRNKAQYAISPETDIPVGLFSMRTHRVMDIPVCQIQNAVVNRVMAQLRQYIRTCGLSVYDETTHTGLLRHVLVRGTLHTEAALVCLVVNADQYPDVSGLIESVTQAPEVKSVFLNFNTTPGDTVLQGPLACVWGQPDIMETLQGYRYRFTADSFFQVNPKQTDRMLATVLSFAEVTEQDTLWDVYCGIGLFGIAAAHTAKQVLGVEINKQAVAYARLNAAENQLTNIRFYEGAAEQVFPTVIAEDPDAAPDVMILDPPRKGCDRVLLDAVAACRPSRLVYVSCNPVTFCRDAAYLKQYGFELKLTHPLDMFPHTVHLETLNLLVLN